MIGTATFAISWLAIAKTDEVVTVTGKLEPLGSVRVVQMPLGGIASEILVQDGDEVKAGQVVMRLDAETTQQRLNSLQESQRLKTLQLSLKEIELEQYLLINTEEESMITKNLELQETIVDRFNTLNKQGGASEIQYLQQKNRSLELEGKLKQVRVERLRQQAFQQQQIKQLKAELEELNARITESNVNLRYQVLSARGWVYSISHVAVDM